MARSMFGVALVFMIASVAPGCGGKTADEDAPDPAPPSGPTAQPGSDSTQKPGDTALGPCTLGFLPDDFDAARCDWMTDGRCYESKLAACACACPRNKKGSTCVSGFFEENGRTEVSCF